MNNGTHDNWIIEYPVKRYELNLVGFDQCTHVREFDILMYVRSGSIKCNYNGTFFYLQENNALFLRAGVMWSVTSADINQSAIINFHFINPLDVVKASDGVLLPPIAEILKAQDVLNSYARSIFLNLNEAISRAEYLRWLKNLVEDLNWEFNANTVSTKHIDTYSSIQNYVLNSLELPFNLSDISNEFRIDKWNLSKAFTPIFGLTLQQLRHASIVTMSRHLLVKGTPVSEIAIDLGYNDQSHFNRFFKRFTGSTPKKWAKYASARKNSFLKK